MLTKACVEKAKAVIVNTRRDDTNILVILTVRHLSKQSKVIASIRDEENIKLARLSGADLVVTPTRVGGYLLADAVETQYATPFLCDLMSTGGHMVMDERSPAPTISARPWPKSRTAWSSMSTAATARSLSPKGRGTGFNPAISC